MPYNGGSSCDEHGYCRVEPHKDGFVLDIFYIIAEKFNFTLRHKHAPKWGTEGDLMEASAGTAIGDIISGEHPLSLSSWYTYPSRFELLDWCNMYVSIEHQFLMRNRVASVDYGFFKRPFHNEVWLAIMGMIGLVGVATISPFFLVNFYEASDSSFLTKTTVWYFFLLIHTFYGGALTMFFASEIEPLFSNIIEIINAYPG